MNQPSNNVGDGAFTAFSDTVTGAVEEETPDLRYVKLVFLVCDVATDVGPIASQKLRAFTSQRRHKEIKRNRPLTPWWLMSKLQRRRHIANIQTVLGPAETPFRKMSMRAMPRQCRFKMIHSAFFCVRSSLQTASPMFLVVSYAMMSLL